MFALPATSEELATEIAELAGNIWASTARFLLLVGEFDRREAWGEWGILSCAHWLAWRCGLSPVAAREHVRVARALRRLPRIAACFSRGELSYSKVRAITRVATPDNEDLLLEWTRFGTAAQLERVVRGVRTARAAENTARLHRRRSVVFYFDDEGFLNVRARLEPAEGAMLVRALEAAEEQLDCEPADVSAEAPSFEEELESTPPHERRRADALTLIAESYLGSRPGSSADRALVVLHVDHESLAHGDGSRCDLGEGRPTLSPETARRLACDAAVLPVTDGPGGFPLSVGRRTRVPPRGMRRALTFRDRGCRFPGCNASRRVQAHHIRHWADDGETALSNLVLLCRGHHRAVHEGGFSIESAPSGALTFRRPDGREVKAVPKPVRPHAAGVVRLNRRAGLQINASTCATLDGRAPNYADAVEGLLRLGCNDP